MLFFDIETECNPDAIQFIDEPSAPANYKDEVKIAAYVAEKKAELIDRAALDADYGRIVAIGMKVDDDVTTSVMLNDDVSESDLLQAFWTLYRSQGSHSCGYNIIGFDLPYLMRRSFDLGVKPSATPDLRRYQTQPTLDLMMVLYNWQNFKSLKFVAKRYGLDNPLPDLDGSQVATMEPETLRAYVENDVYLVYQLWQKMSGIYF
jgi:predicted PolB exonuclease-like 3'-5' exonuclease